MVARDTVNNEHKMEEKMVEVSFREDCVWISKPYVGGYHLSYGEARQLFEELKNLDSQEY
jgi:hypothetical protein